MVHAPTSARVLPFVVKDIALICSHNDNIHNMFRLLVCIFTTLMITAKCRNTLRDGILARRDMDGDPRLPGAC